MPTHTGTISGPSRRIRTMDAARGLAMLLVFTSHFSAVYLARHSSGVLSELPLLVGMIASPTFAMMSGTMLGTLYVLQRTTFESLRLKLLDRSLFLLTIAHVLIACSRLVYERHPFDALRMTFMTDAIGVSIIIGVMVIDRVSARTRLLAGGTLYLFSSAQSLLWSPHGHFGHVAKEILVGAYPPNALAYTVPILPWLGVYLACTAFGDHIGRLYRRGATRAVETRFFLLGAISVSSGLALQFVGSLLDPARAHPARQSLLRTIEPLFSPTMKLPPEPAYVLFFGGLGALLIWGIAVLDHRGLAGAVTRWAAMLGRSSLIVFILQFYVYYSVIGAARLPYTRAWPVLFAMSIVVISLFASWWDARSLNSALTVGLVPMRHWLHSRHSWARGMRL
jgi:uncharacterized membrane protein